MNKKEALALINKDKFLKIPAEFWKDKSLDAFEIAYNQIEIHHEKD